MTTEWPIDAQRAAHQAESRSNRELEAAFSEITNYVARLHNSHDALVESNAYLAKKIDRLLAAAKEAAFILDEYHRWQGLVTEMRAAIAAAEELAP